MEAHLKIAIAMASVLVILTVAAAVDQPNKICGVEPIKFLTCKPAATPPNPPPPSPECCKTLSGADLKCLCKYLKDPSLPPQLGVDPNLAKQIPKKCKLPAPAC